MATGSINLNANLTLNTQSLNAASKQAQQALGRITGQASEFQKSLDASTARVFAFGATTTILNGVSQAFSALISNTIEVEKRINEIGSILGGTSDQLNQLRDSVFAVAKDTGQAFGIVADAAAELARQGLSAEDTSKRLSAALILTRVSGLDSVKSVKALTSAINGFTSAGLTAEQITNKLVAVDTKFAVSAQDLADGFSRAGSTAEDAGVSFDELLGIITAVEQKTARGGAVIGNALKSIFARLGRAKVIDDLKELGVEIDSSQTGIQKLQALSASLEKIADPTVANQIKELAGGVFQINVVSAALKDLGSDTSIFAAAAKTAAGATNEAFTKNAQLNESISAQINSLIVGLVNLSEKIGTITFGPIIKNLLSLANTFSTFLEEALDPEKGNKFIQGLLKTIGAFLSGPGLILITTAFLKIFTLVAKFAKEGFKTILDIGSQSEKIKSIEGGIVGLLSRDQQLRAAIVNTTISQADKQAAIIAAIQRENALLTQQEQLLRSIATAAAQRGVAGYSSSGGFSGKGGKRFADGYMAEEATARMLGATSSVKAKQGKGTIGGQKFIMNNQETEIPNFGRNGDSAVIPHYAKGFIPNFGKTAKPTVEDAVIPQGKINTTTGYIVLEKGQKKLTDDQLAFNEKIRSQKTLKKTGSASVLSDDEKKAVLKERKFDQAINVNSLVQKMPTILTPNDNSRGINYNQEYDKTNGVILNYKFDAFAASNMAGLAENFKTNFGSDEIEAIARTHIIDQSKVIAEALGLRPAEPNTVDEITKGEGFKGAIRAASGALFEAAVNTTLRLGTAKNDKDQGNFDVRNPKIDEQKKLKDLFGNNSLPAPVADFKYSADSTKQSMAGKVYKEYREKIDPEINERRRLVKGAFEKALEKKKKQNKVVSGEDITKGITSPATSRPTRRASGGFIPNYVNPNYVSETLKRIKEGNSGFSKNEQEIFKNKFKGGKSLPVSSSKGAKISLREVFDKLDSEIGISGFIDKAYSSAGPTASTEKVFEEFNKQTKLNPAPLRNIVKSKGFVPNFAINGLDANLSNNVLAGRIFEALLRNETTINMTENKVGPDITSGSFAVREAKISGKSAYNDSNFGEGKPKGKGLVLPSNAISDYDDKLIRLRQADILRSNIPTTRLFGLAAEIKKREESKVTNRNNVPIYAPKGLITKGAAKIKGLKGFASGYIPNFSAINDAISREIGAGVNPSQVYVDQNNSLKNSGNPMGLMVANRRDEPQGGLQGIARARKEGVNAQTYGAAKGFIPNFAKESIPKIGKGSVPKIGKGSTTKSGNYIYDSDKLGPTLSKQVLSKILETPTKKRKDGIIGPSGAGKSTLAMGMGKFIRSLDDVKKADSFTLLSGSELAKTPTGISGQLQGVLNAIRDSGGTLKYLNVPDEEIEKRRLKRAENGSDDLRSQKQLENTSFIKKNQPEFIESLQKEMGDRFQYAARGFVPNFALNGSLKSAYDLYKKIPSGTIPSIAKTVATTNPINIAKTGLFAAKAAKAFGVSMPKGEKLNIESIWANLTKFVQDPEKLIKTKKDLMDAKTAVQTILRNDILRERFAKFAASRINTGLYNNKNVIVGTKDERPSGESKYVDVVNGKMNQSTNRPIGEGTSISELDELYLKYKLLGGTKSLKDYIKDYGGKKPSQFFQKKNGDLAFYQDSAEASQVIKSANSARETGMSNENEPRMIDEKGGFYGESPIMGGFTGKQKTINGKNVFSYKDVWDVDLNSTGEKILNDRYENKPAPSKKTLSSINSYQPANPSLGFDIAPYILRYLVSSIPKAKPAVFKGVVVDNDDDSDDFYAKGFIPNFSAINDAISREIGAGVEPSKVYVDQNNSLKNPMNPAGLMVANRRDEPQGGFQGINRAKKEGASIKTYGMARGFIPNFAEPPASGGMPDIDPMIAVRKRVEEMVDRAIPPIDPISKVSSQKGGGPASKGMSDTDATLAAFRKRMEELGATIAPLNKGATEAGKALSTIKPPDIGATPKPQDFGITDLGPPEKGGGDAKVNIGGRMMPVGAGNAALLRGRAEKAAMKGTFSMLPAGTMSPQAKPLKIDETTMSSKQRNRQSKPSLKDLFEFGGTTKANNVAKTAGEAGSKMGGTGGGMGGMGGMKSIALQMGLSALPSLLPAIKEEDSALKSAAINTISTTAQYTAMGASFGPVGAALGAIAGVAMGGYNAFKEASDAAAKAQKDLAESTIVVNAKMKGLDRMKDLTRSALGLSKVFDDNGNQTQESADALRNGYNSIISTYKSSGVSSKEITDAQQKAKAVLQSSTSSEEEKTQAEGEYTAILGNAMTKLSQIINNRAEEAQKLLNFQALSSALSKFSAALEKKAVTLDQQKFAEGIASNVTMPANAPYAEATKAAIGIEQKKTLATESKVGFMKEFTGEDFQKNLNMDSIKMDKLKGKSGAEISGAISKDVFSAYMKDGAIGAGKALDGYLKTNLKPEDAKTFKDNIISSAATFKNNVAESMQAALNRETEVQNNLSELIGKIKEAGTKFMAGGSGKINELMSGPKLDVLSLQDKIEEAGRLLKSGKKGDVEKGRDILRQTDGDQKEFAKRYGEEKLVQMQTDAGLTAKDTGLAIGSASMAATDLSGVEKAIRETFAGGELMETMKALKAAQGDPTKIQNFIDTVKKNAVTGSEKKAERGSDIVNSLTGLGKTGSTEKEIAAALAKKQITPERAEKLRERAKKESEQATATEDPESKALQNQQKALNVELETLKTKISELNSLFGDTGIPKAVESLTKSVKDAANNLAGFTDFTKNLSSLSNQVNGRLLDIEKQLGQAGK
jgi:TP901 family phage tail tape measure protein